MRLSLRLISAANRKAAASRLPGTCVGPQCCLVNSFLEEGEDAFSCAPGEGDAAPPVRDVLFLWPVAGQACGTAKNGLSLEGRNEPARASRIAVSVSGSMDVSQEPGLPRLRR
jgi:hypothetical protein